jgi:hypothetical protein
MSEELDNILNGSEEPVAEVETPEPETPAEPDEATPVTDKAEPVRDEKGRFAPKGETESASPAPANEPPLDHSAILGERRRRQAAEARIAELEKQLVTPVAPVPQPVVQQQPTYNEFDEDLYWSNPQQFMAGFAQNIRKTVMQEMQGVIPQMVTGVTLDRAERAAKARYEDYDSARDAFYQAAVVNQALAEKALMQPDPAEFAYQEGKRLLDMASYGSTNEYIESEVARRLAAHQPAQPAPIIPESLADAPAAGLGRPQSVAALSLDEILRG